MLGARLLARSLVLLSLAVALGAVRDAHAQLPLVIPDSFEVSASLSTSGDYSAGVSATGQEFFERAGTYEASVSFTASVTVSGVNLLAQSGSFQASGPFTAAVSASDVEPFAVAGTYTAAGTFAAGTFTVSGGWVVETPGSASGSYSGAGNYDLSALTATLSGSYDGTVTSSERGPFAVQGPFSGSGSFAYDQSIAYLGALQTSTLNDLIAGLGGLAAFGPISAAALEMQYPPASPVTPSAEEAPTPETAGGGFLGSAPGSGSGGLLVTSENSSADGLASALESAGCDAEALAILEGGRWRVFIVGAPPQVNALFPQTLAPGAPFFVRCR